VARAEAAGVRATHGQRAMTDVLTDFLSIAELSPYTRSREEFRRHLQVRQFVTVWARRSVSPVLSGDLRRTTSRNAPSRGHLRPRRPRGTRAISVVRSTTPHCCGRDDGPGRTRRGPPPLAGSVGSRARSRGGRASSARCLVAFTSPPYRGSSRSAHTHSARATAVQFQRQAKLRRAIGVSPVGRAKLAATRVAVFVARAECR